MILDCPFCKARYLISAHHFAAGPRQVKCARCSHGWQADIPNDTAVMPAAAALAPASEAPRPIPAGSNLPAIRDEGWKLQGQVSILLAGIVLFILVMWLVFDRRQIAERWPSMNQVYDRAGLHIFHPGEGLILGHVRSELRYDGGIMRLWVDGQIHNDTKKEQVIPPILASAIGPDGNIIQSWQIDPPAATVATGDDVPFHSAINAPKGTVVNVNLSFLEPKESDASE